MWKSSANILNLFWVPSCTVLHTCELCISLTIFLRHCINNNIRAKWAFQHSQVLGINQRAATVDPIRVYFGGGGGATAPIVSIPLCLSMCVCFSECVFMIASLEGKGRPRLFSVARLNFFLFFPHTFSSICRCLSVVVAAHFSLRTIQLHTHTHMDPVFWHTAQTKPHWSSPWHNSRDELTALTSVWTHVTNTHKQKPAGWNGIIILLIIIIIFTIIVSMASPHSLLLLSCDAKN